MSRIAGAAVNKWPALWKERTLNFVATPWKGTIESIIPFEGC